MKITHTTTHIWITWEIKILNEKSLWWKLLIEFNIIWKFEFHISLFRNSIYVSFEYHLLVSHFWHCHDDDEKQELKQYSTRSWNTRLDFIAWLVHSCQSIETARAHDQLPLVLPNIFHLMAWRFCPLHLNYSLTHVYWWWSGLVMKS